MFFLFQGPRASLGPFGHCLAFTTAPLAAGYLFNRVNPMALWYLNLCYVLSQATCTGVLSLLFDNPRGDYKAVIKTKISNVRGKFVKNKEDVNNLNESEIKDTNVQENNEE